MNEFQTIQKWIEEADAIVIATGAGMGVDSGLKTFRGEDGQWGAVEEDENMSSFEFSNPQYLAENPKAVWQFFLNRMKEFEAHEPHRGFYILKEWISKFDLDYFVLTSNIDRYFQRAGFDENRIREVHGSIWHFQSTEPAGYDQIWENKLPLEALQIMVDLGEFPICPDGITMARPNIYMFRDNKYLTTRSDEQKAKYEAFLDRNQGKNIVVFEIGSGAHVQTIRIKTRELRSNHNAKCVRINPDQAKIKAPHIGLAKGALEALEELDDFLSMSLH